MSTRQKQALKVHKRNRGIWSVPNSICACLGWVTPKNLTDDWGEVTCLRCLAKAPALREPEGLHKLRQGGHQGRLVRLHDAINLDKLGLVFDDFVHAGAPKSALQDCCGTVNLLLTNLRNLNPKD